MKTLDKNISNLIKHAKSFNHRTVIILTGENRLKRIGIVCNFIEKLGTKNILYCYVKDNKKRKLEVKGKKRKSVCHNVQLRLQKNCPSEIRWCLYKETQNILGKTFDICIFQDYELLTPNIIARGMETVSGGGLVIFLAPPLSDLESHFNSSYNLSLSRLSNAQRFLKRFTISLLSSKFCICLDDQFNLLNKKKKSIKFEENSNKSVNRDLVCLKESLKISDSCFYPLVNICATYDQARCLRSLCSSILMFNHPSNKDDNDLRYSVISLITAARGRGKSAALGLALCAALETGLTQICVTSPSPENITTLWQYVKLGLRAMNYSEHIDFEITSSYLNDGIKAITKVELKRSKFTQVIRYIVPSDTESIDCDLLCIDEAAAIPSNILQMYLRSFKGLVFVSSTISGYEGSGMMLSRNLFEELRQSYSAVDPNSESQTWMADKRGRLYEITLEEPIRYGNNDPIEAFLFKSLCMTYKSDFASAAYENITFSDCNLVIINRDVLFDCNKSSEKVLKQIMHIYSASNHQNSPDDLKLLADNECIRLLCLTDSPIDCQDPNILTIIQISYEGAINKEYVNESVRNLGISPVVDVLSNLLSEEFLEQKFKKLSGIKIDLIATCPGYYSRGFGSHALKLLIDYISQPNLTNSRKGIDTGSLLLPLSTLENVGLSYVGIYSNLSVRLIKFFQKIGDFMVVHVDSTLSEITNECKGILLKRITQKSGIDEVYSYNWLALFTKVFERRLSLLRYGYLKPLGEEFINMLGNSLFPDIKKEYVYLPNEHIRNFSVFK